MALLQVFSNNLVPFDSNLSVRFTKAKAFYLDASLIAGELEIDVFLQVYIPTVSGETLRNLPLTNLIPADTETLITIPSEYVDSDLEMALAFFASDSTYLEAFVLGAEVTLNTLDSKLNQITQLIIDMSLFLQDSVNNVVATTTTTASIAVVNNTTTISLLAANPNRKRFSLRNKGNKAAYIGFSSTFTTANFYLSLASGAVYESDFSFTGEIFALAIAANSNTDVQVTEFI